MVKNLRAMQETWVGSLGPEGLLEKGMATHSSVLVWRIPWTEPSRLQSMRSQGQTRLMTDTFSFYEIVFLIVTLFSLRICFKIIRTVCSDIEKFFVKYSVCDFI